MQRTCTTAGCLALCCHRCAHILCQAWQELVSGRQRCHVRQQLPQVQACQRDGLGLEHEAGGQLLQEGCREAARRLLSGLAGSGQPGSSAAGRLQRQQLAFDLREGPGSGGL